MAKRLTLPAPKLSGNETPEMLVDELGKLKALRSYNKKYDGFFKEAYYARSEGRTPHTREGETWRITVTQHKQERFNVEAFKIAYPDLYQEFLVTSTITKMDLEHKTDPDFNKLINNTLAELGLDDLDD